MIKPAWLHILIAVAGGAQHGYAIRRDVEARTDGRVRLWPATLYGALAEMVEAGLLEELAEPPDADRDDPRRRYYALTRHGEAALDGELSRLEQLVSVARSRRMAGEHG
jgi:DNA-binding PadR family transcriptional regulator